MAVAAAGGGGWSPGDLANIAHWYDASVGGDFTLVSTDHVSQWNDKVGGKHLTQSTDSARPWRDTTQNGLSVVRFDGGDWLDNTAVSLAGTNLTIFAVLYMATGTGSNARLVSLAASTNGNDYQATAAAAAIARNGSNNAIFCYRDNSPRASVNVSLDTWGLITNAWDASNQNIYLDGGSANTAGDGRTFASTHLRVGAHTGGGNAWTGRLAELAIVTGTSSAGDRSDFLAYSQSKWGTP